MNGSEEKNIVLLDLLMFTYDRWDLRVLSMRKIGMEI